MVARGTSSFSSGANPLYQRSGERPHVRFEAKKEIKGSTTERGAIIVDTPRKPGSP